MKKYFLLLCFLCAFLSLKAQNCNNIGFENGTLSNWVFSSGRVSDDTYNTIFGLESVGIVPNEHIITKKGNDPKIYNDAIPMIAPGSNYSIRFGNIERGGRYNRIKNTFTVSALNTLLQYQFAVVLQNDASTTPHNDIQKPGFEVRLLDATGNTIGCSYYDVQLQKNQLVAGFKEQGDLNYRNWTTIAVDLRAYIGQELTLEATVHGCTKQGHFGYAYFDAKCLKSELKPLSGCPDANGNIFVKAPEGFASYKWSNGDTTITTKIKGVIGQKYSVRLLPYSSLDEKCDVELDYTVAFVLEREIYANICEGQGGYKLEGKVFDATGVYKVLKKLSTNCDSLLTLNLFVSPLSRRNQDVLLCEGQRFEFRGKSYNATGVYRQIIKNAEACDSVFTFNVKVTPLTRITQNFRICAGEKIKVGDSTYSNSGTYLYLFKRAALCDSLVTTILTVEDAFVITISPDIIIENGDSVLLQTTLKPAANYTFDWSPTLGLSCPTCPNTWAKPTLTTTYTVNAVIANGKCFNKAKTQISVSCGLYLPDVFSPNNDGINDIFRVAGSRCVALIKAFSVFDRWGELIYHDQNFAPSDITHGWDGTYRGGLAPPDGYPYQIVAEFKNGEIYTAKGLVNLVR